MGYSIDLNDDNDPITGKTLLTVLYISCSKSCYEERFFQIYKKFTKREIPNITFTCEIRKMLVKI